MVGLPTVAFNRGETVHNGAGWFQINARRGRHPHVDVARVPASDPRLPKNLEVRTKCWVAEILFDEACGATGVRYQRPDLTGYDTVSARREVIVTAGAIDTPKLLMLSGIGPTAHLREIGITVRVDSPGVGANLDDHVEGLVFWEAAKPMVTDVDPVVGDRTVHHDRRGRHPAGSDDALRQRAVRHEHAAPRISDDRQRILLDAQRHSGPVAGHGAAALPRFPGPRPGSIRAISPIPRVTTSGSCLTGVRLARTIAEQTPLAAWVGASWRRGPTRTTDDELLDYIHKCHNTVYHPAATARMGAVSDPMAVLDPAAAGQGRVGAASGGRLGDAEASGGQPQHHGDDNGGKVCRPHPNILSEKTSRVPRPSTRRSR